MRDKMIRRLFLVVLFLAHNLARAADSQSAEVSNITPLLIALFEGDEDLACSLLNQGVDPSFVSEREIHFAGFAGTTILPPMTSTLHVVASSRHDFSEQLVKKLLARGVKIDGKNVFGETPLFLAAAFEKPAIVKVLLNHWANPKLMNNQHETPLKVTVAPIAFLEKEQAIDWTKRLEITELFLKAGINPLQLDEAGHSVLYHLINTLINNPRSGSDEACLPLVERLLLLSDKEIEGRVKSLVEGHDDVLSVKLKALINEWPRPVDAAPRSSCCRKKMSPAEISLVVLWIGYLGLLGYVVA